MSAHKGDKCDYCGGVIQDGDAWEEANATRLIRGELYGAREAWAAAPAVVAQQAAEAFVHSGGDYYKRKHADELLALSEELKKAGEADEVKREALLKERGDS